MPHWKLKSAVQGFVALLPYRQTWNRLLQKYVTKTLDLNTSTFEYKLTLVTEHITNYLEQAPSPKDSFSVLELGTGWHPVIPVGLYLLREVRDKCPADVLDKIRIAKRFRHYEKEDLLVVNRRIISVPTEEEAPAQT